MKGLLPEKEIDSINEKHYALDKRGNFGFEKVEILDGNIGFLSLKYFSGHEDAFNKAVGAMSFLSTADAIIIDLRTNGGGVGGGVGTLLSSYFIDSVKAPLSGAYFRSTDEVEQAWTMPYVPGKRLPEVDLYILTSSRTFSAAEDFAYSLKQLRPVTIVGENTKGGAHPIDVFIVKENILVQLSTGNSLNPITQSNWEGVGIKPDIDVPAESALRTAHLKSLENLLKRVGDDERRQELVSLIKALKEN